MGKVTVLQAPQNPISLIGERAGVCYGANVSDKDRNYKRGLECIKTNHGRTLEFVDVHLLIEGYSARVVREWYTHIGGMPTRLQESTRYVDYVGANGVQVSEGVMKALSPEQQEIAEKLLYNLQIGLNALAQSGVHKENLANFLPLGMQTKIVVKHNVRNLIDMSRQRECTRALSEYRDLMRDLRKALSEVSEEWAELVKLTFNPKCEILGFCPEKEACGRKPKLENIK